MRRWAFLLMLAVVLIQAAVASAVSVNTLQGQIQAIMNRSAVSANAWTVLVQNEAGTITYYSLNPTTVRRPASNTKLFTSAGAFGLIGPSGSIAGTTIQDYCVPVNTDSNNEYADNLLVHIGSVKSGSATFAAGSVDVLDWASSIGINMTGARMDDGSGLDYDNLFSATQCVSLIRYMLTAFPTWDDTLARGCATGTLGSRFCGTAASGRVYGKTGTLINGQTIALSGYVLNPSDSRRYLFSFIANNVGDIEATKQAIDDAVVVMAQSGIPNDGPGTYKIVDNGTTGFTTAGTWTASATTGFYGGGSVYANTGSGSTATFTPTLTQSGNYEVYAWWVAGSNRPTNAVYQVVHNGGTSNLPANQSINGGQWNSLGTFAFNAGTTGRAILTAQGEAAKVVSADAVQFIYRSPLANSSIIADNVAGSFTSSTNWFASTSSPGYYGANYHARATAAVSDSATFSATIPTSGSYKVYARWVAGTNRAVSAPFVVLHSGGSTTVNVNQQANNNTWVLLGTFNFNAGTAERVRLSCWTTAGFFVIADAVRFDQQ